MFILKWGSLGHILSIVLPIILIAISYLILRKRSEKTQRIVILVMMLINVAQHLLKPYVWYPLYHGIYDIRNISFCNICATSILLSPIIFICKNEAFKDAQFYIGILGGILSLWIISVQYGNSVLSIEYIRYFSCHTLLMITSSLPVLLGLQTLKLRNFWKVGLLFLMYETIVFFDNLIILSFENNFDWNYAYSVVYAENQLFICHATSQESLKNTPLKNFHLKYVIDDGTCTYIPILWSAWAIYPFVCGFVLFTMWICSKIKLNNNYLAINNIKRD